MSATLLAQGTRQAGMGASCSLRAKRKFCFLRGFSEPSRGDLALLEQFYSKKNAPFWARPAQHVTVSFRDPTLGFNGQFYEE